MKLLVDGHNLIGRLPDISLADEDDEARLVSRLRQLAARKSYQITVFFDGGLPGGPSRELSGGPVRVIFAPAGQPADPLIIKRIRKIRDRTAWLVVSSDQAILNVAGQHGTRSRRSEELAAEMEQLREHTEEAEPRPENISRAEVDAWLREFSDRRTGR